MNFLKLLIIVVSFIQTSCEYVDGGLEGKSGNGVTLESYRAFETAYAQEILRVPNTNEKSKITYVAMKNSLSPSEKDVLSKFKINPIEFELSDEQPVSTQQLINLAYNQERAILRELQDDIQDSNVDPLEVSEDHLKSMLDNVLTMPRSYDKSDIAHSSLIKDNVATYLLHKFASLGYVTALQKFSPQQFVHALPIGLDGTTVKGLNVIAIAPGTNFGTKRDRIMVIGAHWDTVTLSPGYDDNGSGVASMLEIARAFKYGGCKNNETIIFVAIDMEETGTQGSDAFVKEFLVESIIKPMKYPRFQGAYILDSIANYNDTEGSQLLPDTYKTQVPDFAKVVEDDGRKGDFIGVIGRYEDKSLMELFSFHWNNLEDIGGKFKLRNLILPRDLNRNFPEVSALVANTNFLRSDHIRFWFANSEDYYASFKSVHVSDTGPARGVMSECYHSLCDTARLNDTIPFANIFFLKKITQAMINSVIDATDAICYGSHLEIDRIGKSLDDSYNFIAKSDGSIGSEIAETNFSPDDHLDSVKTTSVNELPTNEKVGGSSDLNRIETLANVKLAANLSDKTHNRISDKFTNEFSDKVTDEFLNNFKNDASEKVSDEFSDKITNEFSNEANDQFSDNATDEYSNTIVDNKTTDHVGFEVSNIIVEDKTNPTITTKYDLISNDIKLQFRKPDSRPQLAPANPYNGIFQMPNRRLVFEPAGPYTKRFSFQGPLILTQSYPKASFYSYPNGGYPPQKQQQQPNYNSNRIKSWGYYTAIY